MNKKELREFNKKYKSYLLEGKSLGDRYGFYAHPSVEKYFRWVLLFQKNIQTKLVEDASVERHYEFYNFITDKTVMYSEEQIREHIDKIADKAAKAPNGGWYLFEGAKKSSGGQARKYNVLASEHGGNELEFYINQIANQLA